MTEPVDKQKIFYIGFPDVQMMTHRRPVPFEVLEENDLTLRIRLLEDCPPLLEDATHLTPLQREGLERAVDIPKAGDEFTIANVYGRKKLTEYLQSSRVAPYYVSEIGEDFFSGVIFSYNPNKKN